MHEPLTLTDDQYAAFWERGFLTIEKITTPEELTQLDALYDQIFSDRKGEDRGRYFDLGGPKGHEGEDVLPQVLRPEQFHPELENMTYRRNAVAVASRLLDTPAEELSVFGHMILKPPGYGRETPWHQDEAYSPDVENDRHSVSFWMPLDDATVESGCMQFIPGSHHHDVVDHHPIDHDPLVHGLMTDDVDPSQAVACPIPAGAATIHFTRTLHYAGPNTTERARRAYILVISGASRPRTTPGKRPWLDQQREAQIAAGIKQPQWD